MQSTRPSASKAWNNKSARSASASKPRATPSWPCRAISWRSRSARQAEDSLANSLRAGLSDNVAVVDARSPGRSNAWLSLPLKTSVTSDRESIGETAPAEP